MKLGVFSLSLFNPESIFILQKHINISPKYTLFDPLPQIMQNCCFTDVFLLGIPVVLKEIEDNAFASFFGGESNKVNYIWECSFLKLYLA